MENTKSVLDSIANSVEAANVVPDVDDPEAIVVYWG